MEHRHNVWSSSMSMLLHQSDSLIAGQELESVEAHIRQRGFLMILNQQPMIFFDPN